MAQLNWHWSNAVTFISTTLLGFAGILFDGYLVYRHMRKCDNDEIVECPWPADFIFLLLAIAVISVFLIGRKGLVSEITELIKAVNPFTT